MQCVHPGQDECIIDDSSNTHLNVDTIQNMIDKHAYMLSLIPKTNHVSQPLYSSLFDTNQSKAPFK